MPQSNTVLYKEKLSDDVYLMRIKNSLIAEERKAGQFIILQVDEEYGERIPLTIADADTSEESITIIFQVVGKTTSILSQLNVGDNLQGLLGPLGEPTHIENYGRVVCVGGGIGVAPLHPIAEALKNAGNHVTTIIGARNKDLVILEDKMRQLSDELIICTDDGSAGRKALVTEPLKEICNSENKPNMVIAIGPPIMMKFCSLTTKEFDVQTMVSLNSIMIDGTGMCGGCRVSVGGKPKFVCVDGPEFDGHQVDFDNLMARLNVYKNRERQYCEEENCHLERKIREKELEGK